MQNQVGVKGTIIVSFDQHVAIVVGEEHGEERAITHQELFLAIN